MHLHICQSPLRGRLGLIERNCPRTASVMTTLRPKCRCPVELIVHLLLVVEGVGGGQLEGGSRETGAEQVPGNGIRPRPSGDTGC
jgi:hypothetical protein